MGFIECSILEDDEKGKMRLSTSSKLREEEKMRGKKEGSDKLLIGRLRR